VRRIGSRTAVVETANGLELRIRSPRQRLILVIASVAIFILIAVLVGVVGEANAGDRGALVAIPILVAVGCGMLYTWLWHLIGAEALFVKDGALHLAKRIGPFVRCQSYALSKVSNVRARGWFGSFSAPGQTSRLYGVAGGTVAFDYSGEPVRFGIELTEVEAVAVSEELSTWLSSRRTKG